MRNTVSRHSRNSAPYRANFPGCRRGCGCTGGIWRSLGRTGKAVAVRQARLIPARGSTTGKKSPAESP